MHQVSSTSSGITCSGSWQGATGTPESDSPTHGGRSHGQQITSRCVKLVTSNKNLESYNQIFMHLKELLKERNSISFICMLVQNFGCFFEIKKPKNGLIMAISSRWLFHNMLCTLLYTFHTFIMFL